MANGFMSSIMGQTSYATSTAAPASTTAILGTAGAMGVGYYGTPAALLPAPLVKDINYADIEEQQRHNTNHFNQHQHPHQQQQAVHPEQQQNQEEQRRRRFVPPPTLINTC